MYFLARMDIAALQNGNVRCVQRMDARRACGKGWGVAHVPAVRWNLPMWAVDQEVADDNFMSTLTCQRPRAPWGE